MAGSVLSIANTVGTVAKAGSAVAGLFGGGGGSKQGGAGSSPSLRGFNMSVGDSSSSSHSSARGSSTSIAAAPKTSIKSNSSKIDAAMTAGQLMNAASKSFSPNSLTNKEIERLFGVIL